MIIHTLLGYDLAELERERFTHPDQIEINRRIAEKGEHMAAWRRFQIDDTPQTVNMSVIDILAKKYATGTLIRDEKADV